MGADIMERLRKRAALHGLGPDASLHSKSADEIERLRAALKTVANDPDTPSDVVAFVQGILRMGLKRVGG